MNFFEGAIIFQTETEASEAKQQLDEFGDVSIDMEFELLRIKAVINEPFGPKTRDLSILLDNMVETAIAGEIRVYEGESEESRTEGETLFTIWGEHPSNKMYSEGSYLYEHEEKPEEAITLLEQAIKEYPDNFQALDFLGFIYYHYSADMVKAKHCLEKACEINPYSPACELLKKIV